MNIVKTDGNYLGNDCFRADLGECTGILVEQEVVALLMVVVNLALPQQLHSHSGTSMGAQGPVLVHFSDPERELVV